MTNIAIIAIVIIFIPGIFVIANLYNWVIRKKHNSLLGLTDTTDNRDIPLSTWICPGCGNQVGESLDICPVCGEHYKK